MDTILQFVYARPIIYIYIGIVASVILFAVFQYFFYAKNLHRILQMVSLVGVIAYTFVILYITLFTRSSKTDETCFIPLYTVFTAKENSENYRTLIMNLLLFLPIGLLFPAVIGNKTNKVLLWILMYSFILSASIEFFQFIYSLGKCEIDDVIMNILGAIVGWLSHCFCDLLLRRSENARIFK